MSKRRLSVFAVNIADWMKYRPYPRFDPAYDGFYLRLANTVFEELNAPQRFFRNSLQREQLTELAVVLTSWFEDYANEIGLWATFVLKNKDLHGYWLPFFDLSGYDPGDCNPEDIKYLCWHYCGKAAQTFIAPDSPGLAEIAEVLIDVFDEALDEAPGTDFYDNFLSFDADVYFFDLKSKLHWMAFQNYLIAPEFRRELEEAIRELVEEKQQLLERYDDPNKLLYAMQDDYLYKKSSSFLAFSTPDWLAEIARCPDHLRSDIRRLFQRIIGEFVYEGDEGNFYKFRHLYTDRHFRVRQESVTIKGIPTGELVFTTIVSWRGEWWVTGTLAGLGNASDALSNRKKDFDPSSVSFYAWPEEQQQALREMCDNMEADHLEFYGARMVFFKSQKDMDAAFKGQNDYYNTKIKGQQAPQPLGTTAYHFLLSPKALGNGKGLALFFEPGEGASISPVAAQIAFLLDLPQLDDKQASPLFFDLFFECSPALVRYMLEHFSARNLRYPVRTEVPLTPHLDFLMRFYNPGAFREKLPNNTFMPEAAS